MARFAVLRMHYSNNPNRPFYPYCSKGLPTDLIERLLATYKSTYKSTAGSPYPRIERWEETEVPAYTMLNWITEVAGSFIPPL